MQVPSFTYVTIERFVQVVLLKRSNLQDSERQIYIFASLKICIEKDLKDKVLSI